MAASDPRAHAQPLGYGGIACDTGVDPGRHVGAICGLAGICGGSRSGETIQHSPGGPGADLSSSGGTQKCST